MDISMLLGILLGGGFLGFIEFLLKRYDAKHDKYESVVKELSSIRKDIKSLADQVDRREAINCRVRILRFADELVDGRRHSKDSFDQVLADITDYNHYCASHPDFKNNQTAATAEHIEHTYKKCMEERSFVA